jgi:hypothetical protein
MSVSMGSPERKWGSVQGLGSNWCTWCWATLMIVSQLEGITFPSNLSQYSYENYFTIGSTYNVTNTKVRFIHPLYVMIQLTTPKQVFNLASGGATIDAALVKPYLPTVLWGLSADTGRSDFWYRFDQAYYRSSFPIQEIPRSKPIGAQWLSNNILFAFWIGINDVVCSVHFHSISFWRWWNVQGNSFGWVRAKKDTIQIYQIRIYGRQTSASHNSIVFWWTA